MWFHCFSLIALFFLAVLHSGAYIIMLGRMLPKRVLPKTFRCPMLHTSSILWTACTLSTCALFFWANSWQSSKANLQKSTETACFVYAWWYRLMDSIPRGWVFFPGSGRKLDRTDLCFTQRKEMPAWCFFGWKLRKGIGCTQQLW